ncbi:MAG: M28 family peptidase [Sphaerochaetaceae bacterium]
MGKVKMEKLKAQTMAKEALSLVSELIEKFGSRLTGSKGAKETANHLADELSLYCPRVEKVSFNLHPKAFLGWIRIVVATYIGALLFLWLSLPIISFIALCGALAVMVFEFFLYKELIDPLYKKVEGINVYGVMEPEDEVLQTVVYSGHHDSAPIFNLFEKDSHLYFFKISTALGSFLTLIVFSFIKLFNPKVNILFTLIFTLASYFVLKLWNFASDEGTPGAGDNLIASTMGIQIARYFKESETPLKHTRLVVASFDAEEAGLRGARHFYQTNKDDESIFKGKVYNFNVDCPYEAKELFFLTSDINGSVKLSQQMATSAVEIAKSMGYEAYSQPIAFLTGGTDAAEAAKVGFEATSLMGMKWDNKERSSVYHTSKDLPEAIEAEAVKRSISIAIKFIQQLDDKTGS